MSQYTKGNKQPKNYQNKQRYRDELLPPGYSRGQEDYRTKPNDSRRSALDRIYNKTTGGVQERSGTRRSINDTFSFEGVGGNRGSWRQPEVYSNLLPDYDPINDPNSGAQNVGRAKPHTVGYCKLEPMGPSPKQTYKQWKPMGNRKKGRS